MVMLTPLQLLLFTCIFTFLFVPTIPFKVSIPYYHYCPTTAIGCKSNSNRPRRITISTTRRDDNASIFSLAMAATASSSKRYGPRDDRIPPSSNDDDDERSRLKSNFIQLLSTIIQGNTTENEYPSLFTQNIDTIMNVIGYSSNNGANVDKEKGSLLDEIVQEAILQPNDSNDSTTAITTDIRVDQVSDAIDLILSFVESFVEETKTMDDVYKQLLKKIFQANAPSTSSGSGGDSGSTSATTTIPSSSSAANMEFQLDNLLSSEKTAFTPGFLRHVEGECIRISSLSTISPESAKMLQILRLIQTRVLEELGKDIGEGAIVLGQLLGYDDESERLAVLDAGLTVRGVEFANELAALTQEALEGFTAVGIQNVDAELVDRVRVIDDRIRKFIEKWTKDDFQ